MANSAVQGTPTPQRQDIANGQLPEIVKQNIAAEKAGQLPWTSALSVSDWLLLQKYKVKPLRLVMGTSYYHFGFSETFYQAFSASGELQQVESALYSSCELAIKRLQEEAELLGAHAVVGIKMKNRMPYTGIKAHEVEYTFTGTAITLEGVEKPAKPILTSCSVPEFVKLVESGSMPVGLALGIGIYYQYGGLFQYRKNSFRTQEFKDYTQASYHARQLAMRHLAQDAKRHGGHGTLAEQLNFRVNQIPRSNDNDEQLDYMLEFIAVGTVVDSLPNPEFPEFKLAVALNR